MLGVSRSTIVRRLAAGQIPTTEGGRILTAGLYELAGLPIPPEPAEVEAEPPAGHRPRVV